MTIAIRPGTFNTLIKHRTATESRDAVGGVVETWATARTIWGSLVPMTGRERLRAMQVDARLSHKAEFHYEDAKTMEAADQILVGTREFTIGPPMNVEEANVLVQVMCSEDV